MANPELLTHSKVQSEWTNPPITTILYKELIYYYWTNINYDKNKGLTPKIVQRMWTIISGEKSGPIAKYIFDHLVFTIPTLRGRLKIPKSTAYKVVKDLENLEIVEKTPFKVDNPDPSYSGRKTRFYKVAGYNLSDKWENQRLKEAYQEFISMFKVSPELLEKKSNEVRLTEISPKVVDYYVCREEYGRFTPQMDRIRDYIDYYYPDLDIREKATLRIKTRNTLLRYEKVDQNGDST
jgi:predicted transcriptional regulator